MESKGYYCHQFIYLFNVSHFRIVHPVIKYQFDSNFDDIATATEDKYPNDPGELDTIYCANDM